LDVGVSKFPWDLVVGIWDFRRQSAAVAAHFIGVGKSNSFQQKFLDILNFQYLLNS
jgi:hypothetical protein